MSEILYGRQPVHEVMKAGKRELIELYLSNSLKKSDDLHAIEGIARSSGCDVRRVDRKELDRLTNEANHQGVALKVSSYSYISEQELVSIVSDGGSPFILCLDHIEDPQNLGSLLRSSDAAGVDAVLIPKDRAADVTAAAVRVSAGASEHVKVCKVTNLVRTMNVLKEHGCWFYGLEALPESKNYTEVDYSGGVGLVVGSEGKGLGRLVRENCDFLVKLPLCGKVTSLNAAVAGAITLFEINRQRSS